jgi:hypothetical protein
MKILSNNKFNTIAISVLAFTISILFYYAGHNIISSLILIITAFALVYINKKEYGYYTNPIGVFSVVWFSTVGCATLRLHPVQIEWKFATWLCIIVAFLFFVLGYYSGILNFLKNKFKDSQTKFDNNKKANLIFITIIFCSSVIATTVECFFCEIPLFSKDMIAYQKFIVVGFAYFGVSSVFVLPLSCIYIYKFKKEISKKEYIFLIIMNIIMFFNSFFILSRGLLLLNLFLALFTLCRICKRKELIIIPIVLLITIFSWKIIGCFKNQDDAYLDKAFQMNLLDSKQESKRSAIKNVKLMRSYMYVCLNYDNFDLNVNEVKYTYGKSSLYSVYVITGLKFITHVKMKDPKEKLKRIIKNKKNEGVYNTYSIMFLSYMDFGVFGVALFMFITGVLSFFFEKVYKDIILDSMLKYCLAFSFFSPYLIYPTTFIFYIALIIVGKKAVCFITDKYLIKNSI